MRSRPRRSATCSSGRPSSTRGLSLVFNDRTGDRAEKHTYFYENGILDHVNELAGDTALTASYSCSGSAVGRDRADQPGLSGQDERGLLLLQPEPDAGILPQLQLAGTRRQPGPCGAAGLCPADQRLAQEQGAVQEKRKLHHLCGCAGLPDFWSPPAFPPGPATRTRPKSPSPTSLWPRP